MVHAMMLVGEISFFTMKEFNVLNKFSLGVVKRLHAN